MQNQDGNGSQGQQSNEGTGQQQPQGQAGQPQGSQDPNANNNNTILNSGGQGDGQSGQGEGNGNILNAGGDNGENNGSNGPTGAPDKYEPFKLGDGFTMSENDFNGFSQVAKNIGLTQEQAQKLVDFQSTMVKQSHDSRMQESNDVIESWKQDTIKQLGENLKPQQAIAKKALNDRPELAKILTDTGLINHPDVFKMVVDYGRLTSEDTLVDGLNSGSEQEIPREKRLFPSMSG